MAGKAAFGVTSRPRPAASASALRMRGWPCPRPAFQVMLPRSHQRAPSAVTKRAPSPPTISSGSGARLRAPGVEDARGLPVARSLSGILAHAAVRRARGRRGRPPRRRRRPRRLRLGDDQRRREPDRLLAALEHQQAALEAELRDRVRRSSGVASSTPIIRPRPRTSVTLGLAAPASACSSRLQRRADARGVRDQLALEQLDGGQARGDGHRVAARWSSRGCPAGQVMISRCAIIAPSGMPEAIPLASRRMSGTTPVCSAANILPGAPHAGLHLVEHQQDAVAVAERAQAGQELGRRHDVAAFAQHRLDHDGGDVVGCGHRREQLLEALGVAVGGVVHARRAAARSACRYFALLAVSDSEPSVRP